MASGARRIRGHFADPHNNRPPFRLISDIRTRRRPRIEVARRLQRGRYLPAVRFQQAAACPTKCRRPKGWTRTVLVFVPVAATRLRPGTAGANLPRSAVAATAAPRPRPRPTNPRMKRKPATPSLRANRGRIVWRPELAKRPDCGHGAEGRRRFVALALSPTRVRGEVRPTCFTSWLDPLPRALRSSKRPRPSSSTMGGRLQRRIARLGAPKHESPRIYVG